MKTIIEQVIKGLNAEYTVLLNNTLESVSLVDRKDGLFVNGEYTTERIESIVTRLFEQGFNEISLK